MNPAATPAAHDAARKLFPQTPSKGRVYNFSAGPACMPECVLEQLREELIDCRGGGIGTWLYFAGHVGSSINKEPVPDPPPTSTNPGRISSVKCLNNKGYPYSPD